MGRTRVEDYTIGWICAIPTEYVAACELLDHEFERDEAPLYDVNHDSNSYTFGRIYDHIVVIACLPKGQYGITSAALVGERLFQSFPNIQLRLMVGIAGGAPSHKHDIRLGDVVVSCPQATHTGVLQYDYGKAIQNKEFQITGHLAAPPQRLLTALSSIISKHERKGHNIVDTIARMLLKNRRLRTKYMRPEERFDRLYKSSYVHPSFGTCDCELPTTATTNSLLVPRVSRDLDVNTPVIHYGLVASANQLMKDANARDALIEQHDVLCFEMEAAGLMNIPCIVIRGICDYSDTHKNDIWQGYAAVAAAAYAKELLEIIPGPSNGLRRAERNGIHNRFAFDEISLIEQADAAIRDFYTSSQRLKIERLSGETLPLDKCYINLLIQETFGRPSHTAYNQPLTIKRRLESDAPGGDRSIEINQLFASRLRPDQTRFEPRRIFIQGRAGIGKTTLCKKIAYEFLQNRLGFRLFDRLLWFSLRSLDNKNVQYGWSELLQDAFPLSGQVAGWEDLVAIMSRCLSKEEFRRKTLFLLDGLDEVSRDWKHDDKTFQFLENIVFNAPNLIITSRPQANSLRIGDFDLEMEAAGFTHDQISTYIDHCVQDKQIVSRMKSLIASKPLLQGLLQIPVQLDAFCCTWNMDERDQYSTSRVADSSAVHTSDSVTTMTDLYQEIMIELCRKDLIRAGHCNKGTTLAASNILNLLEKELSILELFAFQGLISNVIEFNPRHQEYLEFHQHQLGMSLPQSQGAVLEQMSFLRSSDHQLHYRKRIYHFLHLTYQEFFAARYFVQRWKSNSRITCLCLDNPNNLQTTEVLPVVFLLQEKYNPRYSIMWRFVAGLISKETLEQRRKVTTFNLKSQKAESNGVVAFFKALESDSCDILYAQHSRLLMYCLSEITFSPSQHIKHMRSDIEEHLYTMLMSEYHITREVAAISTAEFPENVLRRLLRNYSSFYSYIPWAVTLPALRKRPSLMKETLTLVLESVPSDAKADLLLQAIEVIFSHSELDAQSFDGPMNGAIDRFRETLHSEDEKVRKAALQWHHPLPLTLIRDLLSIFNTSATPLVRKSILRTLEKQTCLSLEVITALLPTLKEKDYDIQMLIGKAIETPKLLGKGVLSYFTTALHHESIKIRLIAIEVLSKESSLPNSSIERLASLLQATDEQVRSSAVYALSKQFRLPQEIMTAYMEGLDDPTKQAENAVWLVLRDRSSLELGELVVSRGLLRHKLPWIRKSTLDMLKDRHDLPGKLLTDLVTVLKDDNLAFQQDAINILRSQLLLPQVCLTSLMVMLGDESPHARRAAVKAFGGKPNLARKDVEPFVSLLHDEDYRVREAAAIVLGEQSSLTDLAIRELTVAIEDDAYEVRLAAAIALKRIPDLNWQCIDTLLSVFIHEDFNLRKAATDVLMGQSSFSTRTTDTLITTLKNQDPYVRESAARILCSQSVLPTKATQVLVTIFEEDEYSRQFATTTLARHFLQPRKKIETILVDLQYQSTSARCAAIEDLANEAPLLQSSSTLVSWLQDSDISLREVAFQILSERSSLPEEASTALVGLLSSSDKRLHILAEELLRRETSLPESTLAKLVQLVQIDDEGLGWRATRVLQAHHKLPRKTIDLLLTSLNRNPTHRVLLIVTGLLLAQSHLPQDVLEYLIHDLRTNPNEIYAILHRNDIYSILKKLNNEHWYELWSFWHGQAYSSRYEFCIYSTGQTLSIWSDGVFHRLFFDEERIKKLLQLSLDVRKHNAYILPGESYSNSKLPRYPVQKPQAITSGLTSG